MTLYVYSIIHNLKLCNLNTKIELEPLISLSIYNYEQEKSKKTGFRTKILKNISNPKQKPNFNKKKK